MSTSNMEVKIHIETECPIPNNKVKDLKITLEDVECIGDLKKKLQPLLQVAACDMSVYYTTQTFAGQQLENREKISDLYVQEGDTFVVKFVSVCEMPFLSEFLSNMRKFVKDVCEVFTEGEQILIENVDLYNNTERMMAIDNCYQTVLMDLERCSYNMFVPWSHKPTNANRHYFAQEGGLELLATIYKFASRRCYPPSDGDEQRYLNDKQGELETYCLYCLWNFSEIKVDRRLVLRKIGLEPFIHSLLKVRPDDPNNNEAYDIGDINDASVGCLAQYVELPNIQQILAENKEVLLKFVWLTLNAKTDYKREVAANTLFCCSNHPKAAAKIIENRCYRLVLERAEEMGGGASVAYFTPAIAYFFCLFLANIQTLPEENLLTFEETQKINKVLEIFLDTINPEDIGQFQEDHNYVWITLVPFLQLALSGPRSRVGTKRRSCLPVSVDAQQEMESQCQENSRDKKTCDSESCNIHGSPYTFSPAEKLGLFCLCHLVNVEENREMFRKEKIFDYLICVNWFAKHCQDVVNLTPKLDGFGHFEPPCLESIAKAYLSKCFGHKIL